jgi:DNA-binding XRE family transcriptional regulator
VTRPPVGTRRLSAWACGPDAFERFVMETLMARRIMPDLIALRERRGLTQRQMAEAMGCCPSTVATMEASADEELSLAKLRRYAAAVGRDVRVELCDPGE